MGFNIKYIVIVLKYMYKLYLGRVRKPDRGLILLNPLNVFDLSPNIAYTSRHLCLFYKRISILRFSTNFAEYAVETITPRRQPSK